MSQARKSTKQEYTYPELLEKYFPGDPYEVGDEPDVEETVLTREAFFDFLKQVIHPLEAQHGKGKSETSA